jgi:hypothetical protein
MKALRGMGFGLALALASANGDVLSGTVTDADAGTTLSGVKVSVNANVNTLSGSNGAFSLNTAPSSLILPDRSPRFRWEGTVGAFLWNGGDHSGRRDIRNAMGARILSLPADALPGATVAPLAAAAKSSTPSALNSLLFEKTGYTSQTKQVDGSQSGLAIKLQKAAAARKANLTWFESYPDPGSEECIKYNGCTWAGQFAAVNGKQPESWVKANNICAVHEKDFAKYKLKTLRLTQGSKTIDVKVYDMCSDSDCDGCCTENAKTGFLIDVEKYTAERFGTRDGTVDWVCVDCAN